MLHVKNLSFSYKKASPPILYDLNFSIRPCEKILIVGKNGAGKTTLSKILSRLLPDAEHGILNGQILLNDKPMSGYTRKELVRRIAILFQDFESQIVSSSVLEEMLFISLNLGISYANALRSVQATAEVFGITGLLGRDIHELSGGEKQKVALFSLLVHGPELLILDEPFTDIETASQQSILGHLTGPNFDKTVVVFEQSLDYVEYFDRTIVLADTGMAFDGSRDVIDKRELLASAGLCEPAMARLFPVNTDIFSMQKNRQRVAAEFEFDKQAFSALIAESCAHAAPQEIISMRDVGFRYKGCREFVLDKIHLSVAKGDFISLLGRNGSGKTTLTKCMAGILSPVKGEVMYNGKPVRAGDVGYVYQNPDNQIFAETVYDEIAFALRQKQVPEETVQCSTTEILSTMGLSEKAKLDPFTLAKGDRQKIACASILVMRPDVVVLDEPTTGLDLPSLREMMKIISMLHREGKTILMITHSMETAALSKTVIAMDNGRIAFHGPTRAFFENDELLRAARCRRTPIMDLSMSLNGKCLLNENEFRRCWITKNAGASS